jgi:hypothetical protein
MNGLFDSSAMVGVDVDDWAAPGREVTDRCEERIGSVPYRPKGWLVQMTSCTVIRCQPDTE